MKGRIIRISTVYSTDMMYSTPTCRFCWLVEFRCFRTPPCEFPVCPNVSSNVFSTPLNAGIPLDAVYHTPRILFALFCGKPVNKISTSRLWRHGVTFQKSPVLTLLWTDTFHHRRRFYGNNPALPAMHPLLLDFCPFCICPPWPFARFSWKVARVRWVHKKRQWIDTLAAFTALKYCSQRLEMINSTAETPTNGYCGKQRWHRWSFNTSRRLFEMRRKRSAHARSRAHV